jgi:hypothetical protein
MPSRLSSAALAGMTVGILCYVHTLAPANHFYLLVWPLLGGGLAVYTARRHTAAWSGVGRQTLLAAGAGPSRRRSFS